jgi:hypothetical protein
MCYKHNFLPIRVLKKAYCWNSGSASSNMRFFKSCPRLKFTSTCAFPKIFMYGFGWVAPDIFCTLLESWNSTAPVSRRTAELVGVVAVNWILCQDTLHTFCVQKHIQFQQLWNTLHSMTINCACYCQTNQNQTIAVHICIKDNNQIFFVLIPKYFDQASPPSEFTHLKINHYSLYQNSPVSCDYYRLK